MKMNQNLNENRKLYLKEVKISFERVESWNRIKELGS